VSRRGWVLVTRAGGDPNGFTEPLAAAGLAVVAYPVLREYRVIDEAGWAAVLADLRRLQAVAFTSPRAPAALLAAAGPFGVESHIRSLSAFAVGEATARAATAAGLAVAAVGTGGGGDLARLLIARLECGTAILHACGREHRSELAAVAASASREIVTLVVYAMDATPTADLPALPDDLPAAVVLTSPRAAEAYAAASSLALAAAPHLAMGATTAARARELGLEVITLRRPSAAAVVEELCQRCS
jgi:uroporphyrinogen-III synthase